VQNKHCNASEGMAGHPLATRSWTVTLQKSSESNPTWHFKILILQGEKKTSSSSSSSSSSYGSS